MRNFKDYNIQPTVSNNFVGDKIPVKRILNQPIEVLDYRIERSKIYDGKDCLHIQISKSGDKRVVFTSSKFLKDQIIQFPKDDLPFGSIIKEINDHYEFT